MCTKLTMTILATDWKFLSHKTIDYFGIAS
jgi:hypothetical protein